MLSRLYSYYIIALCMVAIGTTAIKSYEPEPEKMSLIEYEARKDDLISKYKEMYPNEDKIDSGAKYEVTEVSEESVTEVSEESVTEVSEQSVTEVSEEPVIEPIETDVCYAAPEGEMTYLGSYELTAYMWTGNPCADGVYPSCGYTVACNDPNLWHRWIYIEGYGNYYVHDVGGMPSYNIIDVYLGDYDSCVQFGRRSANVYLIN